jgi:hypothetical protein
VQSGELEGDGLEDILEEVQMVGADERADDLLKELYPGTFLSGTPREQATKLTMQALSSLPPSLRTIVHYPKGDYPGFVAKDCLTAAGSDYVEYLTNLDLKEFKNLRPYLLSMGACLQILNEMAFGTMKEFDGLSKTSRQKLYIAMDLVASCLTYGILTAEGQLDEATRRNLLLTQGMRFITPDRIKRAHRSTVSAQKMNIPQTLPGEDDKTK